jgi:hypothetical protein
MESGHIQFPSSTEIAMLGFTFGMGAIFEQPLLRKRRQAH